ncbi:MAG TPA: transporter associated domain-containing protein, partial [Ktedonobacteraceae bacterium]|nr:transporter associated domain-containing protein [Ktedonobacteraceae bacterium]
IPIVGDAITYEHVTFTVMSTRGRRITKVRVEREHTPTAQAAERQTGGTEKKEAEDAALSTMPEQQHAEGQHRQSQLPSRNGNRRI